MAGLIAGGTLALLLVACTPWLDEFLTTATDQATQNDVKQRLGPPTSVMAGEDGGEVWSYHMTYASYAGGAGKSNCIQYVLTFDKQKVLRKWDERACH